MASFSSILGSVKQKASSAGTAVGRGARRTASRAGSAASTVGSKFESTAAKGKAYWEAEAKNKYGEGWEGLPESLKASLTRSAETDEEAKRAGVATHTPEVYELKLERIPEGDPEYVEGANRTHYVRRLKTPGVAIPQAQVRQDLLTSRLAELKLGEEIKKAEEEKKAGRSFAERTKSEKATATVKGTARAGWRAGGAGKRAIVSAGESELFAPPPAAQGMTTGGYTQAGQQLFGVSHMRGLTAMSASGPSVRPMSVGIPGLQLSPGIPGLQAFNKPKVRTMGIGLPSGWNKSMAATFTAVKTNGEVGVPNTVEGLMAETGLGEDQVKRALYNLQRKGQIAQQGSGDYSTYHVQG